MCDPENCSNSPMVIDHQFKSIILITRDFHKEGKNEENFTEKGFWLSIEQHVGFLSFKSQALSLWASVASNYSFQLGRTAFPVESRNVWGLIGSQNDRNLIY